MTNNIHVYINEPETIEPYHVNIADLQSVTNGLYDSIIFQELNYLLVEHVKPVIEILFQKLSYGGVCFLQFNNLEAIINDYNFNKIDELKLNELLLAGRKSVLNESTIMDMISSAGFTVQSMTYDGLLIKLELTKNG